MGSPFSRGILLLSPTSKHSVQGFPWVFSCKNIFLEWYLDPIKETFNNKNTDPRIKSKFHILNNEHVENHILQYQITLQKWLFRMVEDIRTYLACSNFSSRAAAFAFNRSTWKQRKRQKSMRLNIGHILSILITSDFQSSVCLMLSCV